MPTTETNRAEINKNNAQHSTGPTTDTGKKRSSQNAITHGLTAQQPLLPTEDPEAYRQHVEAFQNEYDPEGATEEHLVQSLADTSWRLNRVAFMEANVLALQEPLEPQVRALANLSLHSQRLSRQFEKTVIQLRDLQKTRQTQQKKELKNLLRIMDMFEAKHEAYDPAEDGFVFTQSQINAAILSRNREILTSQAEDYRR